MPDKIYITSFIEKLLNNKVKASELKTGQKFAPILGMGKPSITAVYQAEVIELPDEKLIVGKRVGSSASKSAPKIINASTFATDGEVVLVD